jgi:hypothetical protein
MQLRVNTETDTETVCGREEGEALDSEHDCREISDAHIRAEDKRPLFTQVHVAFVA